MLCDFGLLSLPQKTLRYKVFLVLIFNGFSLEERDWQIDIAGEIKKKWAGL